jgi:hypothetical protein
VGHFPGPRVFSFFLLLAISAAAAPAGAQPADPQKLKAAAAQALLGSPPARLAAVSVSKLKLAAALALFERAQAAMDKREYDAACPMLEEVTLLLPDGAGGQLALARCYDGAGRLASARTTYAIAHAAALQAHRSDYEAEARSRGEALEHRLARITVQVPDAVRALPGLSVVHDDIVLDAPQWGAALPVDKGRHVVTATAAGKERWERVVDVTADGAEVPVQVTGLVDVKIEVPVPPAVVEKPAPPPPPPPATPTPVKQASTGPWIVGGAGVAALIAGGVMGAIVVHQKSVVDAHCASGPPPTCADQTGLDAASAVRTLGPATTVALTIGAVGVATGALWLGVRRSRGANARMGIVPIYGGAAWRAEGSW